MGTYLKIAWRSIHREKLYALINIAGLGLAIACCIVLGLYLKSELTYDRYNVNYKQIYRVENEFVTVGSANQIALTSAVLGEMLKETYPDDVLDYVRFQPASLGAANTVLIRHDDDSYYWDNVFFADDNVFKIFTFDVIYGDPDTALVDPASIAVSETFARRYFGDENPIGETVTTDANRPLTISLVYADQPDNTHLKYDALLSYNADFLAGPQNPTARRAQLTGVAAYTYLLLPEGYDPQDFEPLMEDFYQKNIASILTSIGGSWRGWLDPLADIHLNADVGYDQPTGNRYYIYGFAAVGIFILLVAAINYVNLATARATRRAHSVGIRKILGANRWALMAQFIGEAMLFAVLAAIVGVVLVEVVLTFSPLETLIDKHLSLDFVTQPWLAGVILGFSLLLGAAAGLYPAFYLSSWAPLTALVGESKASKGNIRFRQILVFTQFAVSIAVIAATLLMSAQMHFIQNKSLGFSTENRLVITVRGADLIDELPAIINDLKTDSHILSVTTSPTLMGEVFPLNILGFENNEGVMQRIVVSHSPVGENFLEAMDMKLVAGRDFSQRLLTDVGQSAIVNEAMVRNMGWDEPLGKRVQLPGGEGRVIGVVADFNFQSLHKGVEPFVMYPDNLDTSQMAPINRPFARRFLMLNIAGDEMSATLRMLQDKFAELDPAHPFQYRFLDDALNDLYVSEQSLMRLIGILAVICILIACLGLYGLSSFTTEQRTKEIGIRKVLGASAAQIIVLLSRNILLLVVAGAVAASIGAWFAIDQWLSGFAYRAAINPMVFIVSTIVAAAVAFVTIALQSYSTARADPADALRYE